MWRHSCPAVSADLHFAASVFFFYYLNLFPVIYDVYLSFKIFITVKLT